MGRPLSGLSSLSYRKRSKLDSPGGKGDGLFSALKENADSEDMLCFQKSKSRSFDLQDDTYSVSCRVKPGEDMNGRESVLSLAYSEANSQARKGTESRWADFDKESTISFTPSRASTRFRSSPQDDAKSTISLGLSSPLGRRRSTSRLHETRDGRSFYGSSPSSPCSTRRSGGCSPGSVSQISFAHSGRLSKFDVNADDSRSVADSEMPAYSRQSPFSRSVSMPPPQGRSLTAEYDTVDHVDVKPVSHRNYLDPDLEKAINEVLSFKPIKFKSRSLEDSEDEEQFKNDEDDSRSVQNGDRNRPASSLRRSASAVDWSSSFSSKSKGKSKKKKRSHSSESDASENDRTTRHRSSSKRRSKKSKKTSKKRVQSSSSSSTSSTSESDSGSESSSSGSTISYKSSSSVKRAPSRRASSPEGDREAGAPSRRQSPNKKEEKKKKKKVDTVMMKYLYRPDSD